DEITTQWDRRSCEKAGLLKMDFLGLRTRTVLDETARLVARHGDPVIDVPALPLDDRATLDLLGRAQTVGVFQLESSGMRDLLRLAMGKKDPKVMAAQKVDFVTGAKAKGIPDKNVRALFNDIAKFPGYGFNKSHSAAYALPAYQTGYLKVYHPNAFMAAHLC